MRIRKATVADLLAGITMEPPGFKKGARLTTRSRMYGSFDERKRRNFIRIKNECKDKLAAIIDGSDNHDRRTP